MSLSDAYIRVMCDKCKYEEEMELTAIACNGWDARNLDGELMSWGWKTRGDEHICDSCLEDEDTPDIDPDKMEAKP